MEWYYPVLGGALRGDAPSARIDERWDDFVVPGLGIRCVDDRPWVTGAETCELVLALDAIGRPRRARASSSPRCTISARRTAPTGPGWCSPTASAGRWSAPRGPGAAMILAADALSSTTAASGIFRGADLPRGLEGEFDCECATSER